MIMSAGGGVLRHQGRGSRSLTGLMVVEGLETKEEAALEIITSEPLTTRSPTRNRARWPASKGRGLGLVLARAASGGGSPSPSPGSSSCTGRRGDLCIVAINRIWSWSPYTIYESKCSVHDNHAEVHYVYSSIRNW